MPKRAHAKFCSNRCRQATIAAAPRDLMAKDGSADRAPHTLRENYLIFKIFASHEIFVIKTRM
jgi:hypothetical protein